MAYEVVDIYGEPFDTEEEFQEILDNLQKDTELNNNFREAPGNVISLGDNLSWNTEKDTINVTISKAMLETLLTGVISSHKHDTIIDSNSGESFKVWQGTSAEYAAIAIKDDHTFYFAEDVEEGTVTVALSTLNLLTNGDMAAVTGWIGTNTSSVTAANNVLSVVGNSNTSIRIRQESVDADGLTGDIYYVSMAFKPLVTVPVSATLVLKAISSGDNIIATVSYPAINGWHKISGKFEIPSGYVGLDRVSLYLTYSAADDHAYEVSGLEADGGISIVANLSEYDRDNGTSLASETVEDLDAMRY